jgi:hypothetical protein
MDMNLYSISETMDFSEINAVLKNAADVLDRATLRMALPAGEEGPELDAEFPLIVKNTFFDIEEPLPEVEGPKSKSCPIAAFNSPQVVSSIFGNALAGESELMPCDLASAARLFSSGDISRAVLEETGHVAPQRARPPPPALLIEPSLFDSSVPSAPTWSPKVSSPPTWSPKLHVAPVAAPQAPLFHPSAPAPTWSPKVCVAPAVAPQAPASSWYRVAYAGGVNLRSGPSMTAPHVGIILNKNEFFAVSEELRSPDGRIYLRLADGRGWAFDDSVIMPYNPTVVKGRWVPTDLEPPIVSGQPASVASPSTVAPWEPMEEPEEADMPEEMDSISGEPTQRRRRKRGGVKRNKAKRRAAEALAQQVKLDEAALEEAETDVPSSSEDAGSDTDLTRGAVLPLHVA